MNRPFLTAAVGNGYFRRQIADSAFAQQQAIDTGEKLIVGVNAFEQSDDQPIPILEIDPAIEQRQLAAERLEVAGVRVPAAVGQGHAADPSLDEFTVVTSEYKAGTLTGVIGVIGPTRMPYDKVISLVTHTSRLLTDLLD